MKTEIVVIQNENYGEAVRRAKEVLSSGGLVAFPTETVYGLGGNAFDATASERIYAAKGRPSDNPLIVHIGRKKDLKPLVKKIPGKAKALMKAFWPGPLTLIFEKSGIVPAKTTGGLNTVAVRMPSDPFANAMLKALPFPVAAPSANRSGRPSTTSASHVIEDLDGRVELIIDDGDSRIGVESTILDLTEKTPVLLRPGHITKEEIEAVIGPIGTDPAIEKAGILSKKGDSARPKAPGMKYRHYAPKAEMTVFSGSEEAVKAAILKSAGPEVGILTVEEHASWYPEGKVVTCGRASDPDTIEHALFAALRRFDALGVRSIVSEDLSRFGGRESVLNRLLKAAGGRYRELDREETT